MDTKNFLKSKINWVAFLTIVAGALTAASKLPFDTHTLGLIVSAIGTINFILRTWFTSTTVTVLPTDDFNG